MSILVLAAGLRLWNHDFDPLEDNYPLYHDAWAKFLMANEVAQGNCRIEYYKQPAFLIYTSGTMLRLSALLGQTDKHFLWRLMVLYMVFCSCLTVGVTYLIARVVLARAGPALLAALFAAVLPASVVGARYIKEDIPMALFVSLSVLFLLLVLKGLSPGSGRGPGPHLRWYLPAGVSVGLALATKYSAAVMLPFFILTHVFVVLRTRRGERVGTAFTPWFIGGIIAVPLVFLIFNPYVVPDRALYWQTLREQALYAAEGHNDGTAIRGSQYFWMFYLRRALLPGMTAPLLAAALIGAGWSVRRRRPLALFMLVWLLFFYLNVENSPAKPFPFFVRYVHSLFPVLCVFAASLFAGLMDRCGERVPVRWPAAMAVAACVLVPAMKSVIVTGAIKNDTRFRAAEWIDSNIEGGARIYLDDVFYSPRPSPERFDVNYRKRMYNASLETLRERDVDYVVLNSFRTKRYEVCRHFSEEAAKAYSYYAALDEAAECVRVFAPRFALQTYGFHNPVVSVYRMPWSGRDGDEG